MLILYFQLSVPRLVWFEFRCFYVISQAKLVVNHGVCNWSTCLVLATGALRHPWLQEMLNFVKVFPKVVVCNL